MTHRTLCLSMLATLEKLGDSPTARIDSRIWHRLYARKLARLEKREKVESVKDDALRECLKYLDVDPDNVFWPRPELIARCKQALEK